MDIIHYKLQWLQTEAIIISLGHYASMCFEGP